jgi:hypothetical protein
MGKRRNSWLVQPQGWTRRRGWTAQLVDFIMVVQPVQPVQLLSN